MVCRHRSCRDQVELPAGSVAGEQAAVAVAADLAFALAASPVAGYRATALCR
jgi:hypothetical protein